MLDDYGPCGLTSLYLVCRIRQVPVEWERLRELIGPLASDGAHSFDDLSRTAVELGMYPVGLKVTRQALRDLPMPAIVHVHDPRDPGRAGHLLVLLRPEPDGVSVLDPPYSAYFLPEARFRYTWTGNILVFARDETEAEWLRSAATVNGVFHLALGGLGALGILAALFLTRRRWVPACSRWWGGVFSAVTRRIKVVLAMGVCLAACGLLFGYLLWAERNTVNAAQCVFDKPLLDLGELPPGKAQHTVRLRNVGDVPLRISKAVSTCTCAAAVKAPEVIEPGQTGVLQVALNISPGPQGARITIESNDPEGPKTVSLSWHGKAAPKLLPYKVEAHSQPYDRPFERVVRVIYPGGKSALVPRLECCECDSPLIEVKPGKNDPLAVRFARSGLLTQVLGEQELHVKVQPPTEPGLFRANCKIQLKYGETTTTLDLPIWLEFNVGELKPEMNTIVFSAPTAKELQGQERLVNVRGGVDADFVVQRVPAWLGCEVLPRSKGGPAIRIKVVKLPPWPLGQHTLELKPVQGPETITPLRVNVFAPSP